MTRPASTKPEAEAISPILSDQGETPLGIYLRQTSERPSDLQDSEYRPSLCTGNGEVTAQRRGQDWESTHTREKAVTPEAAGEIHEQEAPNIRSKSHEKPSSERPSSLEMRAYALSRVCSNSLSQREQRSAHYTFGRDSRSLNQPNLRRCRSCVGRHAPRYPSSAPERRPQPRRWSMCMSDGGGSQHPAGEREAWVPTVTIATVERWYEEAHEAKVADWQQTVAEFGKMWKRWCFAQRQAKVWQDDLIKEAVKNLWQPLSDFDYVLSVYSFLEGVSNPNLLPHLRPTYMNWRSPEQIRFHEGCDLRSEEDGAFEEGTSSDGTSRGVDSRTTASKYPLMRHQHLRVARICGDMDGGLKSLQHRLDVFRNYRDVYTAAIKGPGVPNAVTAECRSNLTDTAREFSSFSKTLINQLRDSRLRLCEALGLDPNQVPGGGTASVPTMTATKYEKAVDTQSPSQGGKPLPRSFWLKNASLQASRIALKLNLYMPFLPCGIAQRILEPMMARSTKMATLASEAGDHKAEATMHRLHNKFRKVSERAGQEFPDVKPRMTLLDSETWPAVLNPRKDMQVEVHGDISLPVETLVDMACPAGPSGRSRRNTRRNRRPPSNRFHHNGSREFTYNPGKRALPAFEHIDLTSGCS